MASRSRLHITGASCSGVTTLAAALAGRLGLRHLDVDDFFWMPTDPPFTVKREPEERIRLIRETHGPDGWVLAGSLIDWGDALMADVDLIVFLYTPAPIRIERLMARERERYGDRIDKGGDMHATHLAFREWAALYDDPAFTGRSLARHEAWLKDRTAPVIRLDGSEPVEALAAKVTGRLAALHSAGNQ